MIDRARIIEDWLIECGHEYVRRFAEEPDGSMVVDEFKVYYRPPGEDREIITEIHLWKWKSGPTEVKLWASSIWSDGIDLGYPEEDDDDEGIPTLTVDLADPDCFANMNEVIYEGPDAKVNWRPEKPC